MKKNTPFLTFIKSLGFENPVELPVRNTDVIRGFRYSGFDPVQTRSALGKARKHSPEGKFVFVLARDRAVRVDTTKQVVLLGNGRKAVAAFLASV